MKSIAVTIEQSNRKAHASAEKKDVWKECKKNASNFVYERNVAVCQSHTAAHTHSSVVIGIVETYSKYTYKIFVLLRRIILEVLNIRHIDSLSPSLILACSNNNSLFIFQISVFSVIHHTI